MNGRDEADLRYLGSVVDDARGHLDAARSASATAAAWTAIMLGRQNDDDERGD